MFQLASPARDSPGITGVSLAGGSESVQISKTSATIGKKRHFTVDYKLEIVKKAKASTNREVARQNSLDESVVRAWRKDEEKLLKTAESQKFIHSTLSSSLKTTGVKVKKFRISGGGRKPSFETLEEALYQWILERRSDCKHVSRKGIQLKAIKMFEDFGNEGDFSASDGWCTNFMKRYSLSIRQKTHQSQKLPAELVPKLVDFFYYLRSYFAKNKDILKSQITAMDETCVFLENVSNKTISASCKLL